MAAGRSSSLRVSSLKKLSDEAGSGGITSPEVRVQSLKRPPKTPDKAYPVAKNQEYACVYDWNDRTS